jgi:hypothetical protein
VCSSDLAIPVGEEKRRLAGISRLPKLAARVKELEAKLNGNGNGHGAE